MLESAVSTPVMAESAALPDDLPPARRVAIAELVTEALATERRLAALYAAFAACATLAPLKATLSDLARVKVQHVAALEPLRRSLDLESLPDAAPPVRVDAGATGRAEAFAQAFQGERALEVTYRELAAVLGDHPLQPRIAGLAAAAGRHRAILRELYLRYS